MSNESPNDKTILRIGKVVAFLVLHLGVPAETLGRSKDRSVSLKLIEHKLDGDRGRIRQLTGFFDKVGWLGAENLVAVDFVLGPMQHQMRRVWLATQGFIMAARHPGKGERLDPAYRRGFEWLAHRSAEPGHHQADLLARLFQRPSIFDEVQLNGLRAAIDEDEQEFKDYLQGLLAAKQGCLATASSDGA